MRKIGIAVALVVVAVILLVIGFTALMNPNKYRAAIHSELERRLDRKVSLGNMHVSLFPPRFQAENISIADDPTFNDFEPFVQAQQLDVSVKLLPLLRKSVQIRSLDLQRPRVELIKNAQGVWNFSTLGSKPAGGPNTNPPGGPNPSPPSSQSAAPRGGSNPAATKKKQQLSLNELQIRDGQVAVTDLENRQPRTVYDHINVALTNFVPDAPFILNASVHFPGEGTQEIRLQGKGGPLVQNSPAITPFHGSLDLKSIGIADFQKFLQTAALSNMDGAISGHTNVASGSGKLSAQGQIRIERLRIRGIDLGYPITADFNVHDDLVSDLLNIDKGAVKLGQTPLYVSGTVSSKSTPALLNLNVKANDISISEAARLAGAAGVAFPPGTTVKGRVNADITARGPATAPVLNGTIAGREIQASGKDLPQPVEVKSINLALTPSEIHSDRFQLLSGGTAVDSQFTVRQYTSKSSLIDATLRAPNAALPAVLAMAKAYGVGGLEKITGAGTLSLDLHAEGPVHSITSDQIMRALNGTMAVNLSNVHYAGTDITHQLSAIGGFLKPGQGNQGYTNIQKMTGTFVVRGGVAQTSNLQAILEMANVGVTGTINLVNGALNLAVTAVLSKAFSQQVGGTEIGGYMNTALANNQGELVIPAAVTGTLQSPRFTPDVQKIAQMKIKGLVPSSGDPLGGAAGILGNLLGQKTANPGGKAQQPSQQKENPVDQILGIFGNKKPNQQTRPK
jgi:AsmA protein